MNDLYGMLFLRPPWEPILPNAERGAVISAYLLGQYLCAIERAAYVDGTATDSIWILLSAYSQMFDLDADNTEAHLAKLAEVGAIVINPGGTWRTDADGKERLQSELREHKVDLPW